MYRKRFLTVVTAVLTLGIFAASSYAQERKAPPNIVFVLADDLSWNLIEYMPNVQAMQKEGVTFSNYFVANSLCCPSRSSIFTGKFPHNTGVLTNIPARPDGGYAAFLAHPTPSDNNEHHTFAVELKNTGYKTAMLGKYLNGYIPKPLALPVGWTEWDVAGDGYRNFNYDLNQNGIVKHYGTSEAEYLTDVVAGLADKFIRNSLHKPFLIEIATFAPHEPYVPAPRDADKFPGLGAPRSPAFGARPDSDSPGWLKVIPPLTPGDIEHIDIAFRKRAQSVQAIDKMIGQIRVTLKQIGKDKNTYIIFSSDNGLHMGEYSLHPGKQTPYDIDVRVPLIAVGPGVPHGRIVDKIAMNIDLCPTFTDLAASPSSITTPDGQSLKPLLDGKTPADWRNVVLIEHRRSPYDPNDPDVVVNPSENPPSYEALRTENALYVEYYFNDADIGVTPCNEVGYYDLFLDPQALKNIAATQTPDKLQRLHAILDANQKCSDPVACWLAQRMTP